MKSFVVLWNFWRRLGRFWRGGRGQVGRFRIVVDRCRFEELPGQLKAYCNEQVNGPASAFY
jgi:hypothetical protein